MDNKDSKHEEECECNGNCDGSCGEDFDCGHDHSHETVSINPSDFDDETKAAIQEIQILEQNFEQLLHQKHLFNMEISETELAIKEINSSEGDIFKIVGGQVVIKTTKEKLSGDLNHKKELLELRMKNIDKQEKQFSDRIEELRQQIMKKIGKK